MQNYQPEDFPNYFADAETNFNNAEYVIFSVPFDKTSSFRKGSSKAPSQIRKASWNFESFNLITGIDFKDIPVHDYGDISVSNKITTDEMIKTVSDFTTKLLKEKKIPICIGGEHSITPGIVKSFPKDTFIICLDAHLDFRESYENDKNNHACAIRRVNDHIPIENIAVIGVRSAEKNEYQDAVAKNLCIYNIKEIRENGIDKIIQSLKNMIDSKNIYLSIDIDVIDPGFAPGTGTPEPFGLFPEEILIFIENFTEKIIGFDIVEVCPAYDNGETSLLAGKLIKFIIEQNYSNFGHNH
jgi:agmatinase